MHHEKLIFLLLKTNFFLIHIVFKVIELGNKKIIMACCGECSSFALTNEGKVYHWGTLIKPFNLSNDNF